MSARKIAACAVMVALLIAVQYALGFVSGVELVTVFLLCFCYAFGAGCGMLVATAFSLLRCLIWGFQPAVIVLYLIYYNLFALLFGLAGKKTFPVWLCPALLILLAGACGYFAGTGVPVSALYRGKVAGMLWALFAVSAALFVFYFSVLFAKRGKSGRTLATVTALAAFCTVCFTLLDDAIAPLFYGWTADAAIAYFYAGFLAMLPQTLCAAASVFLLFFPLVRVFSAAAGRVGRENAAPRGKSPEK